MKAIVGWKVNFLLIYRSTFSNFSFFFRYAEGLVAIGWNGSRSSTFGLCFSF